MTLTSTTAAQHRLSDLETAIIGLERDLALATPAADFPARLVIEAVHHLPAAFDVRGGRLDEHHLGQLRRGLSVEPDLEPILVLPFGGRGVLIDGHHRLEAYRLQDRRDVPVEVFHGTVREAVLEAVGRNARPTLVMSNEQRQTCAWRLVNASFTIAQIMSSSGVSRGQVGIQRKVKKALGEEALSFVTWGEAQRAVKGNMPDFTDADREAWLEAQMEGLAERLGRTFGTKLSTNPELAAGAVARYMGRKLPDFFMFLHHYLAEEDRHPFTDREDAEF